MDKSELKEVGERIEDAMREIGVLLIAFAPLDVALNHHRGGDNVFLLLFLSLGAMLFTGALILERRRGNKNFSFWLLIFLIFGVSLLVVALRMLLEVQ